MSGSDEKHERRARSLGVKIARASKAWVGTFFVSSAPQDPSLPHKLEKETLAFALSLLGSRLRDSGVPYHVHFMQAASEASWREFNRCAADINRCGRLSLPRAESTDFEQSYVLATGSSRASFLSDEVFQDFCQHTGLGADTLVGGGENLASLLFYFILHASMCGERNASAEQKRWLLKAAKDCRAFFQELMADAAKRELQEAVEAAYPAAAEQSLPFAAPPPAGLPRP